MGSQESARVVTVCISFLPSIKRVVVCAAVVCSDATAVDARGVVICFVPVVVLFRVVEYATEVTTAFAVVVSNLLTVETAIVVCLESEVDFSGTW